MAMCAILISVVLRNISIYVRRLRQRPEGISSGTAPVSALGFRHDIERSALGLAEQLYGSGTKHQMQARVKKRTDRMQHQQQLRYQPFRLALQHPVLAVSYQRLKCMVLKVCGELPTLKIDGVKDLRWISSLTGSW